MFKRLLTQPLKKTSQRFFSTSFRNNQQNNGSRAPRNFFNIDLRTLMISLAVISMGVGAYYNHKTKERQLEYKEKRREERKEAIHETKEVVGEKINKAKNWINSKRNKSVNVETNNEEDKK
ncbi:predicted protein [Naegleria gruberi]|uniref:Predicted protein n=1 Tax=Naegleria gruberi TaxID=5762 RepID=D2V4R2_NAEGR|nr:uncharacterized protein NAEGRDRAFT_63878 [Naegleria gruberi]EFC47977.1 predicted protein [Naegleria gruberi]|eukprot:XP_002680721.1 predicted protein [Naegleria gruberi strain NEG-M]